MSDLLRRGPARSPVRAAGLRRVRYHAAMPNVPILEPTQYWECPSCGAQDVTHEAGRVVTRMHDCRAYGGFSMPFVQVDDPSKGLDPSKHHHRLIEREDYLGDEVGVGGIMAVRTERPDGSFDNVAFAPTAAARGRGHSTGG